MQPMLSPVELFIGLRYLRAKRRTKFVSFITLVSLLGIALGVTALIVILSVMNGLEANIRDSLLRMSAHAWVAESEPSADGWRELLAEVQADAAVVAAAPFSSIEGMIQSGRELYPLKVHGVDPAFEGAMSDGRVTMLEGGLDALQPGARGIVLGVELVLDRNLQLGDNVLLLIPKPVGDGTLQPVLERFQLRGVFEAGLPDHDRSLGLAHLDDVAAVRGSDTIVDSVRFRVADVATAPDVLQRVLRGLGPGYTGSDWTVENGSYFRAIRIEKTMTALLVSLVIGVAAFNIVASLVMVVTDKTNDIAVLRTLGMSPDGVVRVFFVQGAMIGWIGVLLGLLLGLLLAANVPSIVPFIENLFGFQIMPGDVYYESRIPSVLDRGQIVTIAIAAFALTSLATLYPARRAALVNPAAALRYE